MLKVIKFLFVILVILVAANSIHAYFGMLLPEQTQITKLINLDAN
ncbi:MAG: hypothetical protein P8N81_00615 [Paracoccaceae bacterium]|nr:hypothetical protein [Paracoccaceae bacterium]